MEVAAGYLSYVKEMHSFYKIVFCIRLHTLTIFLNYACAVYGELTDNITIPIKHLKS